MTPSETPPGDADALERAIGALRGSAFGRAAAAFDTYLEQYPDELKALRGGAEAYDNLGRPDLSAALLERALHLAPDNRDIQIGLLDALFRSGRTADARQIALAALQSIPDDPQVRILLAQIEMSLGDTGAARDILWAIHDADPENIDALYHLVQIGEEDDTARLLEALTPLWKKRDTFETWQKQTLLGFAFGKACERQGDFESAWAGYEFGARTRRTALHFDEQAYARLHDTHRQLFTAYHTQGSAASADEGSEYIFIVSLPRSGSTLVEQIISAHPQATTIGESNIAPDAANEWQDRFGPTSATLFQDDALAAARAYYAERAKALAPTDAARIVDKTITNYVQLGFLATAFPGAKFVHVVRQPMDTALSCFTTSFHAGNAWTYDLAEIGRNIRRYQKLMRSWKKLFPGRIHTVAYEDLVADPETHARAIIAFCGLTWDPACLEFYKSKGAVRTASVAQVRRPVYQSAVDRAAPFAAHLGPLKAALGRRAADPHWFEK